MTAASQLNGIGLCCNISNIQGGELQNMTVFLATLDWLLHKAVSIDEVEVKRNRWATVRR